MSFWRKLKRKPKYRKTNGQPFYQDIDPRVFLLMIFVFSCLFVVYTFIYLCDARIPVLFDPILIPDLFPSSISPKFWMDGF